MLPKGPGGCQPSQGQNGELRPHQRPSARAGFGTRPGLEVVVHHTPWRPGAREDVGERSPTGIAVNGSCGNANLGVARPRRSRTAGPAKRALESGSRQAVVAHVVGTAKPAESTAAYAQDGLVRRAHGASASRATWSSGSGGSSPPAHQSRTRRLHTDNFPSASRQPPRGCHRCGDHPLIDRHRA